MAATRKTTEIKKKIFWRKDPDTTDDQIVKVHIPGVTMEPAINVKEPMVKKPAKFRKPHIMTLQKHSVTGDERLARTGRRINSEIDKIPTHDDTNTTGNVSPNKVSLKDLGPEDKKRVANLIKELAKVGEEREMALTQLTQERIAFEERLQILQEEYDSNIKEKQKLQSRFLELQGLLKKYNKEGSVRNKQTSGTVTSNHTTQTSPRLLPSPEHMPGNIRYLPGQSSSPNKTTSATRQSVLEDVPHPLITDSACQFPSPKHLSRQSTPLPGKPDGEKSLVLPGNDDVTSEMKSASKQKQMVDKTVTGNGTTDLEMPGSKDDATRGNEFNSKTITTGNKSGVPQEPMVHSVHEVTSVGFKKASGSPSLPGSSVTLRDHITSSAGLTEIPTSQQEPSQFIPGVKTVTGNGKTDQEVIGSDLPSYHFLKSVRQPPSLLFPHGCHWPPVYRHPPPASTEHDPPVYSNRMFDVSVTRPDALRQGTTATNRSQADTSQTFSAELDAVYRLYCREYELQLQLQQQQLELQKQQLQLQQQLQQLEFFQQRQQQQRQQQQRPVSSSERVPRTATRTIIRETPDPTPAPQPEVQPHRASALSDLVPTADEAYDSHREQPSALRHQDEECLTDRDGASRGEQVNGTIRRITSSKRPKDNTDKHHNQRLHEDSYTPTNHILQSISRDSSHHSLQPTDERRLTESSGAVSKEIIRPEEASRFRFSLHGDNTSSLHPPQRKFIPHSTRLDSEVDWTNATDFEFRQLQESKIREHYGLGQRSLHSSQALLDPLEPRVTGARYNLYDSVTIAEPVERNMVNDHVIHQYRHPQGLRTDGQYPDGRHRSHLPTYDFTDQDLEERTLQDFSLYENTNEQNKGANGRARFYGNGNHGEYRKDIEPWVTERSGCETDRSLELHYPPQIIDLVEEMEDERTVSPQPKKPSYTVYLSPPHQYSAAQNGGLDSTDSGYSNVSREKSPLANSQGSENETEIEELSVLEDIFFIQ